MKTKFDHLIKRKAPISYQLGT